MPQYIVTALVIEEREYNVWGWDMDQAMKRIEDDNYRPLVDYDIQEQQVHTCAITRAEVPVNRHRIAPDGLTGLLRSYLPEAQLTALTEDVTEHG